VAYKLHTSTNYRYVAIAAHALTELDLPH